MFCNVAQGWQRNIVMNPEARICRATFPVVWRLAGPLGGQYARDRRDDLQSEDLFRRELHLIERLTPTGWSTLEYALTVKDSTVWARPLRSATLAANFFDLGLIDEYWLNANPILRGVRSPFFQ